MVEAKRAKTTAKPTKNLTVEQRLDALEAKMNSKGCSMMEDAKGCCNKWCDRVKDEYAKNPGKTVAIGAGIIIVLLLILK